MQTKMSPMPPFLVPKYSELFMQLGWILFFSMVFPAAAFFTIFAGMLRMNIELREMSQFMKKNDPAPILDIGIWMELMEFVTKLAILVCIYLIIFTSNKLTLYMPYDDHIMYLLAFLALHAIFLIKFLLQEVIEDEPSWIGDQREIEENRRKQVELDNQDKKLWQRLSEQYTETDLLQEILDLTHPDMYKSAQIVPKLMEGCKEWLKEN